MDVPELQEKLRAADYKAMSSDGSRAGCLMLLDTELERKIGLGTQYPFGPQSQGNCLVSKEFKKTVGAELNKPIYL